MRAICCVLAALLLGCETNKKVDESTSRSIITAGGTVTEIVYELGFGENIIATDITSTYPATMQELPSIGYRNQIKAEGILSLGPDLLLAEEEYLSEDVVAQLRSSGLEIHFFEKPITVEETYQLVAELSDFLDVPESGKKLTDEIKNDIRELETYLDQNKNREEPSMVFIMTRGEEMVFLAGEETFASSLISMAGARPVAQGFKEFIPLTPEAIVNYNPDYVLLFESGLRSLGGVDGIRKIRGIENTTAFQTNGVLAYDGLYLSGFGPRVGKAALELAKAMYGE